MNDYRFMRTRIQYVGKGMRYACMLSIVFFGK